MSFSAFLFEKLPAKFTALRISTSTISMCSDEYVFSPGVVTPGRESLIHYFDQVRGSGSASSGSSTTTLESPTFEETHLATARSA